MSNKNKKITRDDAENAIRTLIQWAGDDATRSGVVDTPSRVADAYQEWFAGYDMDIDEILNKNFDDIDNYHTPILLKNIPFHSHCEHHFAPIIGTVCVEYMPNKKVLGISKLARLVHAFALRLQVQERMTVQIAEALQSSPAVRGAAVMVNAQHQCMTTRGVHTHGTDMVTYHFTGDYVTDKDLQKSFFLRIK